MSSPSRRPGLLLCFLISAVSVFAACGDGGPTDPRGILPAETILVAGNIATCGSTNDEATAAILDTLQGTVFTLGDNVFPNGTPQAYADCYEPSWGRHKTRTYATLGNHEYSSGTAAPSFNYFGERAGPADRGYYSLDLGNWHVIVLNINDATVNETTPFEGSPQDEWLQAALASNQKTCTLAMWHNPRFFSSNTAGWTSNASVLTAWRRLYDAGVDLVLNGHQHHYERLAPMSPTGSVDGDRGIRTFNVGTGGESTEPMVAIAEHSEVRSHAFGILKLTLDAGSYSWEFVPTTPGEFTDSGTGSCH